ncbi:MAG: 50S ribosomal protein L6 [Nitrospinaceae bacterium]|jgi:large subunit ribosomal protein L6|tara:strand:- start:476 stop:1021 length:546 start_codon:yes stop_codon:yes gene_type:complete
MSRVGRKPISVPAGVDCKLDGVELKVKGPKGQLERKLHPNMQVVIEGNLITVTRPTDGRIDRSLHGLTRTLVSNMVIGVTEGFSKTLNIVGVGYKVDLKGKALNLSLGYSHTIDYPAPEGIEFDVDSKKNIIIVKGKDKEVVGQVAAEIRKLRPPEPYKGKGVMYENEKIRRKAGKTATKG